MPNAAQQYVMYSLGTSASGALQASDSVTLTADKAIYKADGAANVTLSGVGTTNCDGTAAASGSAKVLIVVLADAGGGTCTVTSSGSLRIKVTSNVAKNPSSASAYRVAVTAVTSADTIGITTEVPFVVG